MLQNKIINPLIPQSVPEIRNTPIMEEDSLPSENSKYLASLLGQGAGMFGAALQGNDITRVGQVFESNRDVQNKLNEQKKIRQDSIEQAKNLMNPASEESKRKRLIYEKSLGIKIPPEFSASDLEDRNVLQGLIAQSQPKPVLGRGGGVAQPKIDKEEQKNIQSFRDATAENNKFLKQLDEYSNLVKKIPVTGGMSSSGASTIESAKVLRGKLLLSLKNIEKTGALDAGMIAIADQILGTPDYTRDDVVNAKTNQLKSAIQDDIQTNAIKFGIVGTAEGEDGKLYYVDKNNNPVMKVQ